VSARFEQFATGAMAAERLWEVVGDLRRLGEWTDLGEVRDAPAEPAVGARVVAHSAAGPRTWRVRTVERRLLELTAEAGGVVTSVGWRVVPAGAGCRLVIAGAVERSGGRGARLRAWLVDRSALRRRADRWALAALEAARGPR
jgi:hypothetical protein